MEEVILKKGTLLNGACDTVQCKVAGVVTIMGAWRSGDVSPNDACYIEYLRRNWPGGIAVIIELFKRGLN